MLSVAINFLWVAVHAGAKAADPDYVRDLFCTFTKDVKIAADMSKTFHAKPELPAKKVFCEGIERLLRNSFGSAICAETQSREQREKILPYIYEAAVDLKASRFDLTAFTALAMYNCKYFVRFSNTLKKNSGENGARGGLLGIFSDSDLQKSMGIASSDPRKRFLNKILADDFSAKSVFAEFSLYMKLLKPASKPESFMDVLENTGSEGAIAFANEHGISREAFYKVDDQLSMFIMLAGVFFPYPS